MRYVVALLVVIIYISFAVFTVRDMRKAVRQDINPAGRSVLFIFLHLVAFLAGFIWLCVNYW